MVDPAFRREMATLLARSNHAYFVRRNQYHGDWDVLPANVREMAIEAQTEIIEPLLEVLDAGGRVEIAGLKFQIEMLASDLETNGDAAEMAVAFRLRELLPKPAEPTTGD